MAASGGFETREGALTMTFINAPSLLSELYLVWLRLQEEKKD
jgi:hypothetical protein